MHLAVEKHKIVKYWQFKYNYHWVSTRFHLPNWRDAEEVLKMEEMLNGYVTNPNPTLL
jgi:hypothetical protein